MDAFSSRLELSMLTRNNRDARSDSSGSIGSLSSTFDVHKAADKAACPATKFEYGSKRALLDVALQPSSGQSIEDEHARIIVIMDSTSSPRVKSILDTYKGHLVPIGSHLLEGLREAAPSRLAARVGDYNENLFYEMRDCRQDVMSIIQQTSTVMLNKRQVGFDNDCDQQALQQDVAEFELSLRDSLQHDHLTYRGSFLQTEVTVPQPAHYDFDYPILEKYGDRLFLAFFPLTEEGAFLQLWQDKDDTRCKTEGTVVYIPYGRMLILPSNTIHGGGFKTGLSGNLRFHLYIELRGDGGNFLDGKEINLLDHPMNKYTEKHDRRRELCERFVDARGLKALLGPLFHI